MATVLSGAQVSPSGQPGPQGIPAVPIGSVFDYAGPVAPSGYLLCYGQAVSRATYSALFINLGTTYGSGDGTTTFNLPDCRGRVTAGDDDMGGTAANRLTTAGSGIDGKTQGASGGAQSIALSVANMAAHSHVTTDHLHGGVTDHLHSLQNHQHYTYCAIMNYQGTARGGSGTFSIDMGNQWSSGPNSATTGASDRALSTGAADRTLTTTTVGSGTAFGNAQPTIVFNKIIYTGVMS